MVKFTFGGGRGRPIAALLLGRQPRERTTRARQSRRHLASKAIVVTCYCDQRRACGVMIVASLRRGFIL